LDVNVRRYLIAGLAIALVAAVVVWLLVVAVPRWYAEPPAEPPAEAGPAPESGETRKIHATLYFVSPGGLRLVAVEREVPYGEGLAEQARRIVEAQIGDAPAPYAAPFPAGTSMRALFVTDRGDAFVDLSRDASSRHPGGSLAETLTVYALVNALTVNLPAVSAVQILVDGQEVDTLAGHIDLRQPLPRNLRWVENPDAPVQQ